MSWVLLPVVGGLIGWLTNRVAIRLLFRPYRPLHLPGFTLQGLLPRRRGDLAVTIGQVVARELLSKDKMIEAAFDPEFRNRLVATVAHRAEQAVRQRIPTFVPPSIQQLVTGYVRDATVTEARRFVGQDLPELLRHVLDRVDVERQVRQKIESLDLGELESLAIRVAGTELRHLEWLGGVLGFLIGLIQALVFALLN